MALHHDLVRLEDILPLLIDNLFEGNGIVGAAKFFIETLVKEVVFLGWQDDLCKVPLDWVAEFLLDQEELALDGAIVDVLGQLVADFLETFLDVELIEAFVGGFGTQPGVGRQLFLYAFFHLFSHSLDDETPQSLFFHPQVDFSVVG